MTSQTLSHRIHTTRPGFGTTILVETRKLTDTRVARILALVAVALTLLFAVGGALTSAQSLFAVAALAVVPGGTLLSVQAILATTSEYANRSVMCTHLLEPDRVRVLVARALALVAVTLAVYVVAYLAAVPVHFVGAMSKGVAPDWSVNSHLLGGAVLVGVLYVLEAYALSLLLLNGPAAIVITLVQPMVFSMIRTALPEYAAALSWVDPTTPSSMMRQGVYTLTEWAMTAVGAVIWLVVPAVIGTARVLRKEVA